MPFDWLESVATGGASDWATSQAVASQLPGRVDGPADAYRHLLISAELHRNFNPTYADNLLEGHELDFGLSSNSDMDFHNNEIGRQIGQYVKSQNGSTQDVLDLVNSVMINSLPGSSASSVSWQQQGNLWVASGATATSLADGASFAPIALSETSPSIWNDSNPVDDITEEIIPTSQTNWPSGDWQAAFNFNGAQTAIDYLIGSTTAHAINIAISTGQSISDALIRIVENNPDVVENDAFNYFVDEHIRGDILETKFNLALISTLVRSGRIDLVPLEKLCFGPEVPIDMWPLEPEFAPDPKNPCKQYDQDTVRAKIWKKPIELIEVGDWVVSHDKDGNMVPGYVPRTMTNDAKILLNFHGTRVTPGHVYYRPDSKRADKYETLIDVLRDDGMIEDRDGVKLRAATYAPVDGPLDKFVQAVTGKLRSDGGVDIKEQGRIRLGTRFIVRNDKGRKDYSVADLIEAGGGVVGDDELIRVGDGPGIPFHWDFGDTLPKPEDFVLAASGTTLEDIYKAAEWESQGPRLPAPMVLDGGPVQPLKGAELSAMPRNEPLNLGHMPGAPQKPQRMMNRKQRKAMEAKSRKAAKARKRAGS